MRIIQITCIIFGVATVSAAQQNSLAQITATITDTYVKALAGGNLVTKTVTGTYYQDQSGRVRIERPGQISIHDPVAGFSAVLDTGTMMARELVFPKRAALAPVGGGMPAAPPPISGGVGALGSTGSRPVPVDLGTATVSGFECSGKKFTTTIPVGAVGNILPIIGTTEVWISTALRLPLMTKTADPLNGTHTTVYDNINANSDLDPSLFIIPSAYQITTTTLNLNAGSPHGLQLGPPAGGTQAAPAAMNGAKR